MLNIKISSSLDFCRWHPCHCQVGVQSYYFTDCGLFVLLDILSESRGSEVGGEGLGWIDVSEDELELT